MTIAIIGGTGVYDLGRAAAPEVVATPYGDAAVARTDIAGREVLFLARHGAGHAVPPHRINYRANIWALQALGVREVLSTNSVGSCHPDLPPGAFALLGSFLDWTTNRPTTFFDGDNGVVVHADVTEPYCPRMNAGLRAAGDTLGVALYDGAVYACTDGPRFETPAEIRALRLLGADLVGMTNVPEVVLAREAGLCYATVCVVCNWAAGIAPTPLTQEEVTDIMTANLATLRALLNAYLAAPPAGPCPCAGLGFGHLLPK
jgi:5'-methylthioadenosine phosphorylase